MNEDLFSKSIESRTEEVVTLKITISQLVIGLINDGVLPFDRSIDVVADCHKLASCDEITFTWKEITYGGT